MMREETKPGVNEDMVDYLGPCEFEDGDDIKILLEERLAEYYKNPNAVIPHEQVWEELKKKGMV